MRTEWRIHPELTALDPVLEPTYGLIVFQEQVLAALNVVCGWSYAEAGLLFDAMRKKNHEKMQATRPAFEVAGRAKGYTKQALLSLWDTLVPFADYSFNRSHTAGYGLLAYWTAFLKANHPVEYMSSLLSSVSDDPDRLHDYLGECERMGIRLLSPDVNISDSGFTPDGKDIRYGLSAIRGVGAKAFTGIQSRRPYSSLADFFTRSPANCLNSGVATALAHSGAFDSLCVSRESLVAVVDKFVGMAQEERKHRSRGQDYLVRPTYSVGVSQRDGALRREWEFATLGTHTSQSTVTIRVGRILAETELQYIYRAVRENPGSQPVTLDFGLSKLSGFATMSLTERAIRAVTALGDVEVFEE